MYMLACAQTGLIVPKILHSGCSVDVMGRKGKAGQPRKWTPKQGPEWVAEQSERLQAGVTALPAQGPPESQAFHSILAEEGQRARGPAAESIGCSSSSAPSRMVPMTAVRTAALQRYRHGEEGLMATGFEPTRHTMMICGRPVQAPMIVELLTLHEQLEASASKVSCSGSDRSPRNAI
jgi:hypothetical protein